MVSALITESAQFLAKLEVMHREVDSCVHRIDISTVVVGIDFIGGIHKHLAVVRKFPLLTILSTEHIDEFVQKRLSHRLVVGF